jgi:hypothetical protein
MSYEEEDTCISSAGLGPALAETNAEVEAEGEIVVLRGMAVKRYVRKVCLARVGKGGPLGEACKSKRDLM